MIVQDDIGIKLQALMLTAKLEGVEENIEKGLPGEDGEPFNYRAGDEVCPSWVSNGIAGSHGSRRRKGGEAELRRKMAFPSWSLGTRRKLALASRSLAPRCVPKLELGNEKEAGSR